ncbi:Sua5/YciO/YrdC/YwlC family protein [Moraxella sp. ZY210820]|uniref:Sua5/YciO/YrdC/YwlC family protein n=1 Tax=unclassified Moraxella TaxID=2685852 RepID=UPI00272FC405|nr:Sua5/YciO/YrdC/YwlC family protein [Moraxella sp. ZY210820]WLF83762.1 Sua5/YciO/YrdC/YwlC family protein [Moraxella sp. ZY210820]
MSEQTVINHAVQQLQHGEVIAYPTEAVWGLGCDPYQQSAFLKILALKQRPIEKGVILLASDIQQISFLLDHLNHQQYQQVISSWQDTQAEQATTWLFPTHKNIPSWITGQYQQVAVRVSHHPICKQLCQQFGGFIVSTSANPSGLTPAQTIEQVREYFPNLHIVNGELGHATRPSRIIDVITGAVLRT